MTSVPKNLLFAYIIDLFYSENTMHLQNKANDGFLPKNIDLEKIKPSTKWKDVQNTFGNESNIKISFIRQLLKEIKNSDNKKISIFIGESPVVGEPDYEVARTRMEFEKNIIEELEKNKFITNQHTTRKSTDEGHYEDTIYVNFEIIKKDIVKYLRSLLMKILKKEEEKKKLQKKKEKIKYSIEIVNQTILLNNKYIIGMTDFESVNSKFFAYAYLHSGEKIFKKDIKIDAGIDFPLTIQLRNIIYDIGFSGELKNMFFPSVSKNACIFDNYLTEYDLREKQINIKKLEVQIKALKKKL